MSAHRRLIVAGGASGRDASYEALEITPAIELATTTVHEIAEMKANGKLADRSEPWHHDPEPDGAIFRLVTLAAALPDAPPKEMHSSPTVDVGVVLQGTVTLVLPNGQSALLDRGDCFVLRGVEHAWRNDASEQCVMAVTLLKPSNWPGATGTDLSRGDERGK
jgi:hypothetical protein